MEQGRVVDLNDTLAMNTAKLSLDNKLPMADGIILATAHAHNSVIWTQDADFKGIRGVKYIEKRRSKFYWDASTINIQGRPERLTCQEFCNVSNNVPKVSGFRCSTLIFKKGVGER